MWFQKLKYQCKEMGKKRSSKNVQHQINRSLVKVFKEEKYPEEK